MTLGRLRTRDTTCVQCGFDLWLPLASLDGAHLGLYSDARFPGRCILSLERHRDHFDELAPDEALSFSVAIKNCVQAIKAATGAPRVNVAILGNEESHVHAHLIPRYPSEEERPNRAPWEDRRAKSSLSPEENEQLISSIGSALDAIYSGSTRFPINRQRKGVRVPRGVGEQEMFSLLGDADDVVDA